MYKKKSTVPIHLKTIEKSTQIKSLYDRGVILGEIASITQSSTTTVKKVLLKAGIDFDAIRNQNRKKTLEKVIELYNQGKAQVEIEKELKLTRKTIRELLKSADVQYRDFTDQIHIKYKTKIDHTVFDNLTPESLYWIGMLYSDGHIVQKEEASIELTLHNNDKNHLEKFKEFLKSDRKITKGGSGECSRVRVNSRQIRNRLVDLGFIQNKSTTIHPHELLKHSKDFWRGCIDGDGGIYWRKDNTGHITLCGTLETIFEFAIFCNKYIDVKDKYPTKSHGENFYQISYYGQDAKKIANYLYQDATVYLERKYQIYLTYFKEQLQTA